MSRVALAHQNMWLLRNCRLVTGSNARCYIQGFLSTALLRECAVWGNLYALLPDMICSSWNSCGMSTQLWWLNRGVPAMLHCLISYLIPSSPSAVFFFSFSPSWPHSLAVFSLNSRHSQGHNTDPFNWAPQKKKRKHFLSIPVQCLSYRVVCATQPFTLWPP